MTYEHFLGALGNPRTATPPAGISGPSRAHLADMVWIDTKPLDPQASYILRAGPIEVPARVETVRYVRDITTGEQARGHEHRAGHERAWYWA